MQDEQGVKNTGPPRKPEARDHTCPRPRPQQGTTRPLSTHTRHPVPHMGQGCREAAPARAAWGLEQTQAHPTQGDSRER